MDEDKLGYPKLRNIMNLWELIQGKSKSLNLVLEKHNKWILFKSMLLMFCYIKVNSNLLRAKLPN